MVGKKGKSSNDKSVKAHKLSLTKFSGGSTKKKSKNKNTTNRVENQKTRNKDDFAQQLNELRERSLGNSKAATAGRKTEKPTLKIREATFQIPSAISAECVPANSFADQYLEGERSQVVPTASKASKAAKLATFNRFELLENDELLEDGSHSILVMDVKPATFSLQSRETTF